jgi:hypothetical protein
MLFTTRRRRQPTNFSVSIKALHALLLAKQTTQLKQCTLGNVEALARTDARSDHAVLDFFVSFFIKKKRKNRNLLSASTTTSIKPYTAFTTPYSIIN